MEAGGTGIAGGGAGAACVTGGVGTMGVLVATTEGTGEVEAGAGAVMSGARAGFGF